MAALSFLFVLRRYLLEDEAAPPLGLLDAAAPPPLEDAPPPLEDAPPLIPPLEDAPPAPELLVPPIPDGLLPGPDELEEELPGVLGEVAVEEEDDEPPGTTTVSFSLLVVEEVADPLGPPGTTVVVSLRSHAESASAPNKINT